MQSEGWRRSIKRNERPAANPHRNTSFIRLDAVCRIRIAQRANAGAAALRDARTVFLVSDAGDAKRFDDLAKSSRPGSSRARRPP